VQKPFGDMTVEDKLDAVPGKNLVETLEVIGETGCGNGGVLDEGVLETGKGNFNIAIALGILLLAITFLVNWALTVIQQRGAKR